MLGERDNHYTTKPRTMRHLICTACSLVRQPAVFGIIVCLYLCGSELWSRCEDISHALICVYADIVIFKDIKISVGQ